MPCFSMRSPRGWKSEVCLCTNFDEIVIAIKLFLIGLLYKVGEKMVSTWVISLATKLLKNVLKSVKITKEDIIKMVDYVDKDSNGEIDGLELFNLFLEYRTIKK